MSTGVSFSPPEPASPEGATVKAGAFWPAVDLNTFRDTMRIGGATIADPRLVTALRGAILHVARELVEWKAAQIEAGYTAFDQVPSDPLSEDDDAVSELLATWQRAVYNAAAADLCETHRDITATPAGAARAAESYDLVGDCRRNATHAVRDILGLGRTKVSLL